MNFSLPASIHDSRLYCSNSTYTVTLFALLHPLRGTTTIPVLLLKFVEQNDQSDI